MNAKRPRKARRIEPAAPDEPAPGSTPPEAARGLAAREPITSLRWYGRAAPSLLLSTSQARFTLGTQACDLLVPAARAGGVAPLHAVLERDGAALHVIDQETAHGTYPGLGVARMASFQVQAGQSFWIAGTRMLAMDTQLEVLRPRIADAVGLARHVAIDEVVEHVASGRPLALVGPRGTEARRLAEAIHAASPQRDGAFVDADGGVLPDVGALHGAAVFVDLDRVPKVPAKWLRAAFDPARALRIVLACADDRRLRGVLDVERGRVAIVRLVPLAQRPDDVPGLIARIWIDELRTHRRVEELGVAAAGLSAYAWPGNLEELRQHARRLLAYLEYGGLRPAAAMLGIKHQTLAEHFRRIGFVTSPWGRDGTMMARDGGAVGLPWSIGWGMAWPASTGSVGAWSPDGWVPLWPIARGELRVVPLASIPGAKPWLPGLAGWRAQQQRRPRRRSAARAGGQKTRSITMR